MSAFTKVKHMILKKSSFIFLFAMCLQNVSTYAQAKFFHNPTSIPIYKSKQDSLALAALEQKIGILENSTPVNGPKLDSLLMVHWNIYQTAIIGFRKIYSPGKDHISLDSLSRIKNLLTVKKVSIHNYEKTSFPPVILQCKNLESLEFLNTRFRSLPKELNSLTQLQAIKIYNNQSQGALKLKKNRQTKTLIIRTNNPKTIPNSFRLWPELQSLDLAENMLTRFPNGARHNSKLSELNLQHNRLSLRRKIKRHPYVQKVGLQYNNITKVPASIKNFHNLRKLNFNYNKINRVHSAIGLLNKLEQLSFYHNELESIPSGVYQIQSLREIDLFYNKIEKVEPEFSRWKNLTMLYLSHNRLVSMPESIQDLSSLQGLYVWDNRMDKLPEALGNINGLRFIWANNNNLNHLPNSILQLDNLEELDVSHNFISEIPEAVFDFKHLKILSLVSNPWNKKTIEVIQRRVWELRARNVFVHISDSDPSN